MSEAQAPAGVITVGPCVARWISVHRPVSSPKAPQERFKATLILRKDNQEHLKQLQACLEAATAAMRQSFGKEARWITEGGNVVCPLQDGANMTQDGFGPGTIFLQAYAYPNNKPYVVDRNVQPLTDEAAFYDGVIVRAAIRFYVNPMYRRVNVGLNGVQKIADGVRLGRERPEAVFQAYDGPEFEGDAGPLPAGASQAPASQAQQSPQQAARSVMDMLR